MSNKPILFCDFDGTICRDRYWTSLPPEEHEQVQKLLFRENTTRVNDWMRGKYTAEEINQWLSDRAGIPYERLWDTFVSDCLAMRVSKGTLEKLSSLRNQYQVILMTGNMDSFSRFTAPKLELEKYFDHISNSFYEGRHKTDDGGKIFTDYAMRFGAPLSDCIVLDDSKNVCATFESLGGKAYRITPETTVDHFLILLTNQE